MQFVWEATSLRAAVVSNALSGPTRQQVPQLARHAQQAAQQQKQELLAPTTAYALVSGHCLILAAAFQIIVAS